MWNAIADFLDQLAIGRPNLCSQPGLNTRRQPRPPECLDLFTVTVKQPRNYPSGGFLLRFGVFELLLDDLTQTNGERKIATFEIFCLARIERQPAASLQVHMMFLPGENFVVNPPAADVCSLDSRLQIPVLRGIGSGNPVFPDASNRKLT